MMTGSNAMAKVQKGPLAAVNSRNYATADIFGALIRDRKVIPGYSETDKKRNREYEMALFECIDDYVEQA